MKGDVTYLCKNSFASFIFDASPSTFFIHLSTKAELSSFNFRLFSSEMLSWICNARSSSLAFWASRFKELHCFSYFRSVSLLVSASFFSSVYLCVSIFKSSFSFFQASVFSDSSLYKRVNSSVSSPSLPLTPPKVFSSAAIHLLAASWTRHTN